MTDYKSYSLEQLENWIHDAICAGEASPHEIYSTIRKAVKEEYDIHRNLADRCFGLLELLSGYRPVNLNDDWENHYYPEEVTWTKKDVLKEKEYYEPSMPPWGHSDIEGLISGFGNDVITFNFDPAGNNVSDLIEKPNKWVVPVEVDGASGEYYLTLPDDLLDSLGWKEGDNLEYLDNDDGTFKVRKITKPLRMDEC